MRKLQTVLSRCLGLFLVVACAWAGEPVVIVNKSNPMTEISRAQLKKILLGKMMKWPGGGNVELYLGPAGEPERKAALQHFCGLTEADYTSTFLHASFKGEALNQPKTMPSAQSVAQLVQMVPGAVGIVSSVAVTPNVKVIPIAAAE